MFSGWVQSMILYLILAGLAVNMAPASQYKQYIRYFTGLVVIVILARPLNYVFHLGSGELEEVIDAMSEFAGEDMQVLDKNLNYGTDLYDYYDAGLRRGMVRELEQFGVVDMNLIMDQQQRILQCTVYVEPEKELGEEISDNPMELQEQTAEIKKYICDVYNVEEPRIYVVRR